jgi:hypothetical protein
MESIGHDLTKGTTKEELKNHESMSHDSQYVGMSQGNQKCCRSCIIFATTHEYKGFNNYQDFLILFRSK